VTDTASLSLCTATRTDNSPLSTPSSTIESPMTTHCRRRRRRQRSIVVDATFPSSAMTSSTDVATEPSLLATSSLLSTHVDHTIRMVGRNSDTVPSPSFNVMASSISPQPGCHAKQEQTFVDAYVTNVTHSEAPCSPLSSRPSSSSMTTSFRHNGNRQKRNDDVKLVQRTLPTT
jgi:hypothetical protein